MTDAMATMLSIWQEVLDRAPITPETDLFEDGVESIKVIRLLATIERRYGVALDLGPLLVNPTPRGFVHLLQQGRVRGARQALCEPLRQTGSPAALHVVSGVDGYTAMPEAERLSARSPTGPSVYAYRSPGLDGGRLVHSVAGHARVLHRAYRERGDEPVAVVVGYSTGGCIAMELARCLGREGRRIGLVVVEGPLPTGEYPRWSFAEEMQKQYRWLAGEGGIEVGPDGDGAAAVRELLTRQEPGISARSVRQYLRLQRVFIVNRRAWLRFQPRPIDCRMVLVMRHRKSRRAALMRSRWGPYVSGRIQTAWAPVYSHEQVICHETWFDAACEMAAALRG